MKLAKQIISCLWWTAQGILWMDISGLMSRGYCVAIGIMLMLCGLTNFCNLKNVNGRDLYIVALLLLTLYSVALFPVVWFIVAMACPYALDMICFYAVPILSLAFCIRNWYKLFKKRS